MPDYKFKVGDRVIFTNDYGVCWGVKTITALDERTGGPTYYITPTDCPWFSSPESNFQLADEEDLAVHEATVSSSAIFPGTAEDVANTAWRFFQNKYGRPSTREERAALLDTDPFEGEL